MLTHHSTIASHLAGPQHFRSVALNEISIIIARQKTQILRIVREGGWQPKRFSNLTNF